MNDLGSGSNVDLCIITKDGVEYLRNHEYLQAKTFQRQFPQRFAAGSAREPSQWHSLPASPCVAPLPQPPSLPVQGCSCCSIGWGAQPLPRCPAPPPCAPAGHVPCLSATACDASSRLDPLV
jgi:hypothetical protein